MSISNIVLLVAKDTSNPAILKLVLATLSCNWKVNFDALSKDCLPENLKSLPESAQVYMPTNQIPNPSISSVSAGKMFHLTCLIIKNVVINGFCISIFTDIFK